MMSISFRDKFSAIPREILQPRMDELKKLELTKLVINFRYEETSRLEVTNIRSEDKSSSSLIEERINHLNDVLRNVTYMSGFYENDRTGLWTYNCTDPNSSLISILTKLRNYGDERIVSVRDSLGHNIANDRFEIEVTVK